MRDSTGRSQKFGFVTYRSQSEAASAIMSMDNENLDGQLVRVSIANRRESQLGKVPCHMILNDFCRRRWILKRGISV
jgi:RNA recognition motif-containing protein